MAQHVETATDYKHTCKDLGLIMVNVYGFVFHASSMLKQENSDIHPHTQTNGRYQTYYLPCFAVDNYHPKVFTCLSVIRGFHLAACMQLIFFIRLDYIHLLPKIHE